MDCANVDTTQIGFIGQEEKKRQSMVVRKDPMDLNVELSVLSTYALKRGPCLSRKGLLYFTDNSLGVCSM